MFQFISFNLTNIGQPIIFVSHGSCGTACIRCFGRGQIWWDRRYSWCWRVRRRKPVSNTIWVVANWFIMTAAVTVCETWNEYNFFKYLVKCTQLKILALCPYHFFIDSSLKTFLILKLCCLRGKLKSLCFTLWQYGLWSFQTGDTKLEIFLPKNQF